MLLIFHNLAYAFDVYVPLVCPLSVLLLLVVARLYDCRGLVIILIRHDSPVIHAAVLVVLSPGRGTSLFHEGKLLGLHGGIKNSFVELVVIVDSAALTLTGNRLREGGLG